MLQLDSNNRNQEEGGKKAFQNDSGKLKNPVSTLTTESQGAREDNR